MAMQSDDGSTGALPINETFDVWWPKYLKRVHESVEAAEKYLEVPPGTISTIPSEPDFVAIVKIYAVVEPVLNDLLAKHPPTLPSMHILAGSVNITERNANFRSFVTSLNIGGGGGKLRLAEGLSAISADQARFIRALARVRNRYAHNVKNMHRRLYEILAEEKPSDGKIIEHLTGASWPESTDATVAKMLNQHYILLFTYHRLADFLSSALHTLKPPPIPSGGVLGDLLGLGDAVAKDA